MPGPSRGPLDGLKVIELAGVGPGPFCAMLLADQGAEVLRIARPGVVPLVPHDLSLRNRATIELDLRRPDGRAHHHLAERRTDQGGRRAAPDAA